MTTLPADTPGYRAPTIIVLHGGSGATHDYLRPEWDRLTAVGRVVYYDQRGCGKSTRRGPYSWQGHVSDLDDLVHDIAPQQQVVLAGTSWGSILAVLYAHEHPERVSALVLSGTIPWHGSGMALLTDKDSSEAGVGPSRLLPTDTLPPVHVPLATRRADTSASGKRLFEACLGVTITRTAFESMPTLKSLSTLRMPILIIAGSDTTTHKDGSAELARTFPHARRIELEGAGHDPWFDQTERFFNDVIGFIESLSPSTR